jgi:hypothetical protein
MRSGNLIVERSYAFTLKSIGLYKLPVEREERIYFVKANFKKWYIDRGKCQ